ncbi:diacylglycerol/lipid kinase family protein [Actinoplanes derwentensis]|uniref:Diacylglycerol kinase family enzyme n=1 Tax=Actinoplanes derwentensis TaxID=113562 RepID=A0A1H2CW69_9ACTN|nr:diacylglycerol kinase family protein [Actinoplanes derwentensis]GID88387.1 sphingosine kinase [Actinoplanes derwentensis]SDT74780.1 Diacylglycerol kinase family enzyme [Actinoplanes derwentensis]
MTVITGHTNPAPRSAVVVNPAKIDDLDGLRQTVEDTLSKAGWPVPEWFETTEDDPGLGQTRAAVESGAEVVFVCGGDGTVMSAVSALAGTEVSMAVLPAGTGNLLAANLGLSTDLATGLAVALEGGLRRLDVGTLDGRHFVVMAGMGFDARMLDATSDTAKKHIGWPAYVLGAVKHLKDRPMRVTIRIDGGEPMRRRARTVLVANVGRLQGGLRLLSDAQPDDGVLDIAILTPNTLRTWVALGWGLIRRSERIPALEVFRGSRIEVISSRPQPRQLDGDLIETSDRLTVEVMPQALWLCVPEPAGHPDLSVDADAAADRLDRAR